MSAIVHRPQRSRTCVLSTFLLLAGLSLLAAPAAAGWENGFWAAVIEPVENTTYPSVCSDGQGGSLVAARDHSSSGTWITVSRLDHTGNEVWGDGGVDVPLDLTSDGLDGPVAVAPDGSGGAWVAYREIYGGDPYLSVARFDADGNYVSKVVVASMGALDPNVRVAAVPTGAGDVIVVFNRNNVFPDQPLMAARVNPGLTVDWVVDIGLDANVSVSPENWLAAADGQGGVYVGTAHTVFMGPFEFRVQRVDGSGGLVWGAGIVVALPGSQLVTLLPGATGDTFVVSTDLYGAAYAQRLDAVGGLLWAAGGIVAQNTATQPNACLPAVCTDQAGGFMVVGGVTDLVANRIDAAGTQLWSPAITLTSLAGWQTRAHAVSDGFGGMLVAYQDHYYSQVSDPYCHALSARRVDAFGTVLWGSDGFWWTTVDADPDWRVEMPVVVADGSGGGHVVWDQYEDTYARGYLYAAGLGPAGNAPPVPTLAALWPDGGAPGEVLPAQAWGDYLDPLYTYALEQGGHDIPLAGISIDAGRLIDATIGVGAAPAGGYDLVARDGGVPVATLADAFGVGEPPPCPGDQPMGLPDVSLNSFGSQRKAAVGPDGLGHFAYLGYDAGSGEHIVFHWVGDGGGGGSTPLYATTTPLRDLALALDDRGDPHFVFVSDDGFTEELHYIRAGGAHFTQVFTDGVRSPALAVDGAGDAMIVFESDIMGESWLFYLVADDGGLGTQTDLISGAGAREPDVSLADGGFALTFVRDYWIPGWREVCRQHHASGSWQSPVSMYFGVSVWSPTVAWDGADRLLFGFVLDNTGSAPLMHTMLMEHGVAGPVRWRLNDGRVHRGSVAASGPGVFRLLTHESEGGVPQRIYLRAGDGNTFHARRQVNTRDDVGFPVLAAQRGGPVLFAVWEDYELAGEPTSCYWCGSPVSAASAPAVADAGLRAHPNPFNPRTVFSFTVPAATTGELSVFDLRGRRVRRLHAGPLAARRHAFAWNGTDDGGRILPSGVYIGRLRTQAGDRTTKVLLLK